MAECAWFPFVDPIRSNEAFGLTVPVVQCKKWMVFVAGDIGNGQI